MLKAVLPGGYLHDPKDLSGQAWLVSEMMGESAGGKSALEISSPSAHSNAALCFRWPNRNDRDLEHLKDNLTEMLPYFVNTVLTPDFREEDWQRVLK